MCLVLKKFEFCNNICKSKKKTFESDFPWKQKLFDSVI